MKMVSLFLAVLLVGSAAWFTGDTLAADRRQVTDEAPMDCTITVKGTVDGVAVNVTITVSNVSLLECVAMKAAVRAAMK